MGDRTREGERKTGEIQKERVIEKEQERERQEKIKIERESERWKRQEEIDREKNSKRGGEGGVREMELENER